jgi:hypothetical protein
MVTRGTSVVFEEEEAGVTQAPTRLDRPAGDHPVLIAPAGEQEKDPGGVHQHGGDHIRRRPVDAASDVADGAAARLPAEGGQCPSRE